MEQQLGNDKVHALHVFDLLLVITKRYEHSSHLFVAATSDWFHEVMVPGEGSTQIPFYLRQWVLVWFDLGKRIVSCLQLCVLNLCVICDRQWASRCRLVPVTGTWAEHREVRIFGAVTDPTIAPHWLYQQWCIDIILNQNSRFAFYFGWDRCWGWIRQSLHRVGLGWIGSTRVKVCFYLLLWNICVVRARPEDASNLREQFAKHAWLRDWRILLYIV